MSEPLYIVVGRSKDCELRLTDPSVSGRHARLSWRGAQILVEDLHSANGTWLDGEQVREVTIRPGAHLRFGSAEMPWSNRALKRFLRRGALGDTLLGVPAPGRRFVCGSCGGKGVLPDGKTTGKLQCGHCQVELSLGTPSRRSRLPMMMSLMLLVVGVGFGTWAVSDQRVKQRLVEAAARLGLQDLMGVSGDPRERAIARNHAPLIAAAIDSSNPTTRNTAVRLAAESEGPFSIEQVAGIWFHVRREWNYANDPRGDEFFAAASQSIDNDYAGDCDDFAIVLAGMIEAIGGEVRVVLMDGEEGGHAYTEVCIEDDPVATGRRLARYSRRHRQRDTRRRNDRTLHFRSEPDCPTWLNLDWNAGVPGGPYGRESWAVAIDSNGDTRTLAPAGAGASPEAGADVRASALPPR